MRKLIPPVKKARIAKEIRQGIENRRRIEYHLLPVPRPPELFYMDKGNAYFTVPHREAYSVGGIHWADHLFNSGSR